MFKCYFKPGNGMRLPRRWMEMEKRSEALALGSPAFRRKGSEEKPAEVTEGRPDR